MRFNGTIKKWNDENGFGFIQPSGGGVDLFVHISELQKNGLSRPRVGDQVTFEVLTNGDGKKKAVNVQTFGALTKNTVTSERKRSINRAKSAFSKFYIALIGFLVIAAVLFFIKINRSCF